MKEMKKDSNDLSPEKTDLLWYSTNFNLFYEKKEKARLRMKARSKMGNKPW